VLLLGVGTWLVFAEPARSSGALGGPLVVTSAAKVAAPPPTSPAAADSPAPEVTAVSAPRARRVAQPAASAAPAALLDALAGTPAAPVTAPTPRGSLNESGRPHSGGQPTVDPSTSAPGPGRSLASSADAALGTSDSSTDSARGWLTVNPGRWGGTRSATIAGRTSTLEPSPSTTATPAPDATAGSHG
jgi:hypothetical protein